MTAMGRSFGGCDFMDTGERGKPAEGNGTCGSRTSRVLPLTSLRFFAALYVVFFHTLVLAFGTGLTDLSTVYGRVLLLGYISVSFFFTLSGYILAVSYLPRRVSTQQFWWARFARVYPLFLFTLFLSCPQYFVGAAKRIGYHAAAGELVDKLVGNIFLLQAWIPSLAKIDFPNWSLSVEAFFYLLFPFLLAALAKPGVRLLAATGIFTYLAGICLVVTAMHAHVAEDVLRYNPLFHLHTFVIGAVVGVIHTKVRLHSRLAPAFLVMAIVCFVFTVHYYSYIPFALLQDGLLVPAFVCLILAFDSGNKGLDKLLSAKWLVILGEASYGLYLIHIPLWDVFHHLRVDHSGAAYLLYLFSAITLSVLSFFYLETPLRRFLTKPSSVSTATAYWRRLRPLHNSTALGRAAS
jgi:peptidoglycan/LPS O-acetylase OafA/YrhL